MRFILALTAALLLGGCDFLASDPEPLTGTITGRVILAETGEPIEGLGVMLRATGGFGSSAFIRARHITSE